MYSGAFIILIPLIIGWCIPVSSASLKHIINRSLSWMVYVILFFMGISLAFLDNLGHNLFTIFKTTAVFAVTILLCNYLALRLFDHKYPWIHQHSQKAMPSRLKMIIESLQLCGVVLLGFMFGWTGWHILHYASQMSEYALLLLLLLVGIQLRNSGLSLYQILFNRRGAVIAFIVACSALGGGAIAALILNLPVMHGLALASGFGWYSLSGILLTDSLGPVLGSSAFFNDLFRELVSIILIPTLMHRHRATGLGLAGATSMDFTLPVLERAGGTYIVPAAIVHGFILSLLAPVLMTFFSL